MYHGKLYLSIFLFIFAVLAAVIWLRHKNPAPKVTNFEECAAAGYPVMESYPRQCTKGGRIFVETVIPERR